MKKKRVARRRERRKSAVTQGRERQSALFSSLFPQTFPAAPLLPNRFFHRDRTCVFCVRKGGIRSRKFPADLYVQREFNVRVLKSFLLDLATETLSATSARVLFDFRHALKLQSCCANEENHSLRGLLYIAIRDLRQMK